MSDMQDKALDELVKDSRDTTKNIYENVLRDFDRRIEILHKIIAASGKIRDLHALENNVKSVDNIETLLKTQHEHLAMQHSERQKVVEAMEFMSAFTARLSSLESNAHNKVYMFEEPEPMQKQSKTCSIQ